MEKYILIEVIDREISTTQFNSFEDANKEMKKRFYEYVLNSTDNRLKETEAWITDGAGNLDDLDWKIIKVKE